MTPRHAEGPRFDDVQEGDLLQLSRAWPQPYPVADVVVGDDGDRVLVVARDDGLEIQISRATWTHIGSLGEWVHVPASDEVPS